MIRRRSVPLLALSLLASLAVPAALCAPATPLRITLRVVEACRLPSGDGRLSGGPPAQR